ncbi:MAG: glycosyl hydrolase family 28-related protein, partial [Phycisphaerae bacterium]
MRKSSLIIAAAGTAVTAAVWFGIGQISPGSPGGGTTINNITATNFYLFDATQFDVTSDTNVAITADAVVSGFDVDSGTFQIGANSSWAAASGNLTAAGTGQFGDDVTLDYTDPILWFKDDDDPADGDFFGFLRFYDYGSANRNLVLGTDTTLSTPSNPNIRIEAGATDAEIAAGTQPHIGLHVGDGGDPASSITFNRENDGDAYIDVRGNDAIENFPADSTDKLSLRFDSSTPGGVIGVGAGELRISSAAELLLKSGSATDSVGLYMGTANTVPDIKFDRDTSDDGRLRIHSAEAQDASFPNAYLELRSSLDSQVIGTAWNDLRLVASEGEGVGGAGSGRIGVSPGAGTFSLRSTATSTFAPTSGAGLEFSYDYDDNTQGSGSRGAIVAYDRDASTYEDLRLNAMSLHLQASGVSVLKLTASEVDVDQAFEADSFNNEGDSFTVNAAGNLAATATTITGNIAVTGTVDGRDIATDGTKLDGIEAGATSDMTDAQIKTAYENNVDTEAFNTAEQTKLAGIEASATADQNGAEIKLAYEAELDTNAYTDAEKSKLAGVEAAADVTDAANVNSAGAVMESDYNAQTMLRATLDDTPTALTVAEQTVLGRLTGENISDVAIGIANNNIVQIDGIPVPGQIAQFTANGLQSTTAGAGDMTKAVYDSNDDGVIDSAQIDPTLSVTSITASGLTAGRVALVGGSGEIIDDAELLYNTSTDELESGNLDVTGAFKVDNAAAANQLLSWSDASTSILVSGFVNVETYGADGSDASDDSTAIKNAIDAADAAGGGTVYFPRGTYTISSDILLTNIANVTFRGDGIGATDIQGETDVLETTAGATPYLFWLKGDTENVTFTDLTLSHGEADTNSAYGGISFGESSTGTARRTHFERVELKNFLYFGVDFNGTTNEWNDVNVSGCWFHDINNAAHDTVSFWGDGSGGALYGAINQGTVTDNYFENCGEPGNGLMWCGYLGGNSTYTVNDLIWSDNVMTNCGAGLTIGWSRGVLFANNRAYLARNEFSQCLDTVINGNVFRDSPLLLWNGTNYTVSANQLIGQSEGNYRDVEDGKVDINEDTLFDTNDNGTWGGYAVTNAVFDIDGDGIGGETNGDDDLNDWRYAGDTDILNGYVDINENGTENETADDGYVTDPTDGWSGQLLYILKLPANGTRTTDSTLTGVQVSGNHFIKSQSTDVTATAVNESDAIYIAKTGGLEDLENVSITGNRFDYRYRYCVRNLNVDAKNLLIKGNIFNYSDDGGGAGLSKTEAIWISPAASDPVFAPNNTFTFYGTNTGGSGVTAYPIGADDADAVVYADNCMVIGEVDSDTVKFAAYGAGFPNIYCYWRGSLVTENITWGGSPEQPVIDAAADEIPTWVPWVRLTITGGDYTLTNAPTMIDGYPGQIITVTAVPGEADTVTVQDQDTLASSNLQLGAATRDISDKDV